METVSIRSIEDVLKLGQKAQAVLAEDIDCHGVEVEQLLLQFRGDLNGNGYAIKNLVIKAKAWGDEQVISLFPYLSHATIKDIRFEDISFLIDTGPYTPRICGLCYEALASTISNVSMEITTNTPMELPLVMNASGTTIDNAFIVCNGKKTKVVENEEE